MKKLKPLFAFLYIGILLTSCSKDDDKKTSPSSSEVFFSQYLTATGFDQETDQTIDGDVIRFGLGFTPLVNGNITALNVKLPKSNNALEITIWDADAQTVLRTETVNFSTENVAKTFDIADLSLTKDKLYAITMKSGSYYDRSRTDDASATYPIVLGNIRIEAFVTGSGNSNAFEFFTFNDFYLGDLSFNFQPTE